MKKLKKHVGLIILLIIAIIFPTSLSNQTKLNMRIIVTGLALDKSGDEFEVTAQIVKTSASSEGTSASATVDFISDKSDTVSGAISKLAYKAGKASAFSHTNYVILGKSMLEEDLTKDLDYFIRDKIIKNSALVLFAEEKASDEIKKTKSTDLSVGIGLQKVFLFKEHESDGSMMTMMDFLNQNKDHSKTATASILSLKTNEETSKDSGSGSGSTSGSSSSSSSGGSGGGGESSDSSSQQSSSGSGSGEQSGTSSSGGGLSGGSSESQYFASETPVLMFVSGRYVGKLETPDEVAGFMLSLPDARATDITITSSHSENLKDAKIEVNIKNMKNYFHLKYKEGKPVLELKVKINNAEINEILSDTLVSFLKEEEYKSIGEDLKRQIQKNVEVCFKKAQSVNADVFDAYNMAIKFHYKKTKERFASREDFLKELSVEIKTDVQKLDY